MSKKEYILPSAAAVLILIFLISLIPGVKGGSSEKFTKTTLLNQKNIQEVSEIYLYQSGSGIRLYKNNGIWAGTSPVEFNQQKSTIFPADSQQVENLLKKLTDIRRMYEISDNKQPDSVYGLEETSFFHISYNYGQEKFTDLYLGSQDFSQNYRYTRINGSRKRYKLEWKEDAFMHTEARFWYDPHILPEFAVSSENPVERTVFTENKKTIIKTKDQINKSKFLELRHGSLFAGNLQDLKKLSTLKIETGEGKDFQITAYSYDDQDVVLDYELGPDWSYSVFVSQWTYGKLKELIAE